MCKLLQCVEFGCINIVTVDKTDCDLKLGLACPERRRIYGNRAYPPHHGHECADGQHKFNRMPPLPGDEDVNGNEQRKEAFFRTVTGEPAGQSATAQGAGHVVPSAFASQLASQQGEYVSPYASGPAQGTGKGKEKET